MRGASRFSEIVGRDPTRHLGDEIRKKVGKKGRRHVRPPGMTGRSGRFKLRAGCLKLHLWKGAEVVFYKPVVLLDPQVAWMARISIEP